MLLHESRRAARTSADGELVLLADQDRALWNREQIAEGAALVERALDAAAARSVHAAGGDRRGPRRGAVARRRPTGRRSSALYDVLLRADPSPVVELNRAAAVAMRDGPAAGLALIDAILARGELGDYQLAHSARAELCRRLGRVEDARASYQRALALTRQEPERRFLERRLGELGHA